MKFVLFNVSIVSFLMQTSQNTQAYALSVQRNAAQQKLANDIVKSSLAKRVNDQMGYEAME